MFTKTKKEAVINEKENREKKFQLNKVKEQEFLIQETMTDEIKQIVSIYAWPIFVSMISQISN